MCSATARRRAASTHDHQYIRADTDGTEIRIFGFIKLAELEPRLGRIQLKVEGCGLHGRLLVTGEPGEAV